MILISRGPQLAGFVLIMKFISATEKLLMSNLSGENVNSLLQLIYNCNFKPERTKYLLEFCSPYHILPAAFFQLMRVHCITDGIERMIVEFNWPLQDTAIFIFLPFVGFDLLLDIV